MVRDFWQPKHNINPKLKELVRKGAIVLERDKYRIVEAYDPKPPYIMYAPRPDYNCLLWKDVYFENFGIIPRWCRESCWKAVVALDTVEQVFDIFDVFQKFDFPRKIGIDPRSYTPMDYAIFIYGTSEEEVQSRLNQLLPYVPDTRIKPWVKFGCTEMALKIPTSPVESWQLWGKAHQELEDYLDNEVFIQEYIPEAGPPESHWNRVFCDWIRFAHTKQDMTYKNVVGDININT